MSEEKARADSTAEAKSTAPDAASIEPPTQRETRRGGGGSWIRAALAAVGFGRSSEQPTALPGVDRATLLAEERTRLARDRSFLAAERTLMAWVRTSMSMISFGFTMVKFFEYLEEERHLRLSGLFGRAIGPAAIGFALISLGTLALVVAVVQHRRSLRLLHRQGLEPKWSLALTVATVVAVLGVFAFGSLVLHY